MLISMFSMYFIFDMVTNLDRLSNATPEDGKLIHTLLQYYGVRSLSLFNTLNAAVILLAAVATVSSMQSKNELIALHSMGAPPTQIAKPLILLAILLATLAALNREILLPRYQQALSRSEIGRAHV